MLAEGELRNLIEDYQADVATELEHLRVLYEAYHDNVTGPYIPRAAGQEFKTLLDRSRINLLPLVVAAASQSLHVEHYRSRADESGGGLGHQIFEKNQLGARQAALIDAALLYGYAYTSVLPGEGLPSIATYSPRRMYAIYDTPGEDEFPRYAFGLTGAGRVSSVWDDEVIYHVTWEQDPGTLRRFPVVIGTDKHSMGVCPIQRHVVGMDLEGRATGEVEGLIPLQVRLNQLAFDELIAVSYNSFKVRGVSGLVPERDPDGNPIPIDLNAARMIHLESPDSKPWQLDGTDLSGYLQAVDQVIKQIAAVSQTPVHVLQGSMANLSAEALAAAESGLMRKIDRYQHRLGESLESMLRLAVVAAGGQDDPAAEVIWSDTESRTLSTVSDALVKLAAGLEVPPQGLWSRIPGVTQGEIDWWTELREQEPANQVLGLSAGQKQQMPDTGNANNAGTDEPGAG